MLGGMKFTLIPRAQVAEVLASAPQPAGGLPAKYIVTLTTEERAQLQALTQAGRIAARTLKHAWILLKTDASPAGPAWSDSAIRTAFDVGWSTIARVRQACVEHGVQAPLYPKRPPPRLPSKLDGANEAHLSPPTCSAPPTGQERSTLRLLAERFVTLAVSAFSHVTVR